VRTNPRYSQLSDEVQTLRRNNRILLNQIRDLQLRLRTLHLEEDHLREGLQMSREHRTRLRAIS
jgi:hypothetical protein